MVFPLRRGDGIFRPFLTRVMPVKDSKGKVRRWFGTNTDISEQANFQKKLTQSESRFRALIEQAPDALFVVDTNGRFVDSNPASVEMFGYEEKELLELGIQDMISEEDGPCEDARVRLSR